MFSTPLNWMLMSSQMQLDTHFDWTFWHNKSHKIQDLYTLVHIKIHLNTYVLGYLVFWSTQRNSEFKINALQVDCILKCALNAVPKVRLNVWLGLHNTH